MGLKQVITDRLKRLSGTPAAAPAVSAAAAVSHSPAVFALWRDLVAHWRTAEPQASDSPGMVRVAELEARIATSEGRIDDGLASDLLASVRELTLTPLIRLRERVNELAGGSRSHQRAASAHQLKLTHLQDEIARCRAMIEQECRRRGINLTSKPVDDDNLHDLLYQVFKAISHAGSRRMQAAGSDPIIAEIDRLIASEDPAAVEAFPAWLRAPAARILAVVQERNRYKRLLANRGLLAPE